MADNTRFNPPLGMTRGSEGKLVNVLVRFLIRAAARCSFSANAIEASQEFFDEGLEVVLQRYQESLNITPVTGVLDQQTVEGMIDDDVDFFDEANRAGDHITKIVVFGSQEPVYWSPGTEASPSWGEARKQQLARQAK